LKLERSVDNLAKKLDRLDLEFSSDNMTGLSHWKGKPIIPLDNWIELQDRPCALDYFPDDFDQLLTNISENELGGRRKREDAMKWNSDFIELMEHTRNPNYGEAKCFHCLLSPAGDDPIFIGINRLVAKGLTDGKHDPPQYPCKVVDRFHCPYERTDVKRAMISAFDVKDLFKLEEMAFAVEISFAKARKEDSRIRVRNKEELLHALTDMETLAKILEQGSEAPEVSEAIRTYLAENRDDILDYFMKVQDRVNLEELRLY
jgi:hypothetical protein